MTKKRILMLAWEYPPRIVGGLARVVWAISRELVKNGHEVVVITADHPGTPAFEKDDAGVLVYRVQNQTDRTGKQWSMDPLTAWASRFNVGTMQIAARLHLEKPFDLVHPHDWMVLDAAWSMHEIFDVPIVSTIHATEYGRNGGGIYTDNSRHVDELEWRLIYESRKVIVNSQHMHAEVVQHFGAPGDKVEVIPNGIEPDKFKSTEGKSEVRRRLGLGSGPVMVFVGRLVHEKGVQHLLSAIPRVLQQHHDATFIIAGEGGYAEVLRQQAGSLGILGNVRFFGKANDSNLRDLYAVANALIVPSTYEPFGIVALEGMAANVPVIVSDTGGLKDIVKHEQNGITTYTGNSDSIAWGILHILGNPKLAAKVTTAARQMVLEKYTWEAIAARTMAVYDEAIRANSESDNVIALPMSTAQPAA